MAGLRVRRNFWDLQDEYDKGNKKPLDTLIRAFKGIYELSPDNPNSFFFLAGLHGEPFRGAGWGNASWWGGYCNHGNVLFPTWHRAYCFALESALQSIHGCKDVTLPYWNEIEKNTQERGIPGAFLKKKWTFEDGGVIDNPLYSYKFQQKITDNLPSSRDDADYSKGDGYVTCRYPYSGLVGPADKEKTDAHNAEINKLGDDKVNQILNENVKSWLLHTDVDGQKGRGGVLQKYFSCLEAPNYTVFSNTTSATQWNEDHFNEGLPTSATVSPRLVQHVVPLESPHNDIHVSIGGFEYGDGHFDGKYPGANGDMGENDTAAFDPVFFFHHCFIDAMFWQWQKEHGKTKQLDIIPQYPGTNSVDSQGPTPGTPGGTWLTLDTPLDPFQLPGTTKTMKSKDVIDIETRLGYTYSPIKGLPRKTPSAAAPDAAAPGAATPDASRANLVRISGINRGIIPGSFVLSTWTTTENGEERLVGFHSTLSRWHVQGCANCQTHLRVKTFVPLYGLSKDQASKVTVKLHTRDDPKGSTAREGGKPIPYVVGHLLGKE
ncbi:hypothetical protein NUU61_005378 [Penicillium alfredii]|uniref:tyrosinase n=1 Tax=Penicillium alfredii TaxID=1506179 RepID=A0A9W9F9P6_9EURO|nr:uncharacterized protein NUU61_005378 [Penicillium alfredii]KAJ5096022.1 hypothetical protein NUU61_005378 [Penicillium alfredii]